MAAELVIHEPSIVREDHAPYFYPVGAPDAGKENAIDIPVFCSQEIRVTAGEESEEKDVPLLGGCLEEVQQAVIGGRGKGVRKVRA